MQTKYLHIFAYVFFLRRHVREAAPYSEYDNLKTCVVTFIFEKHSYKSKQLNEFCKYHGGSGFGKILYDKYVKVAIDKKKIERVANMDLYQIKSKVKYLSEEDVDFLWEEGREEIAENMLKEKLAVELIEKVTGLSGNKIKELKDRLDATKK